MILLSEAYRRASAHPKSKMVASVDPGNDYLSYFPPRRIEAEVLRDSILAVSAQLSADAGGPRTCPRSTKMSRGSRYIEWGRLRLRISRPQRGANGTAGPSTRFSSGA